MLLNMLNDLPEATKALDGKKNGMAFSNRIRSTDIFSKVCLEFVHMKTQHIEGVKSAHSSVK